MTNATLAINSFVENPDDWTVTPRQCLMKNGHMRIWLRDGISGYSSGSNMACDNAEPWTNEEKLSFASAWAKRKANANIAQFPYPHRTLAEIDAEQSRLEGKIEAVTWEGKSAKPPKDWDGGNVVFRNGRVGMPIRWARYKRECFLEVDVMFYFRKRT